MGRRRRINKRDKYGIYEIPEYSTPKRRKRKKKRTLKDFFKGLAAAALVIALVYGVSFGVKYSMRDKAVSLYEQGDYEGALALFEEGLKPQLPFFEDFDNDIRFHMADCYINQGEYGDACYMYNKIRLWSGKKKIKGIDKLEKIAYGLQLYAWQEYRGALPILLEAYENGYGDLVLYVGSCYGQTGDLNNMQLYYDVFLQNNPMNSFMYAQYAAIALDEGRMEDALNYIETGKQIEDQSNIKEILYDEIVYYEKQKDYNTAYEKAKSFIEAYPADADGKNEYDILYTRQTLSDH